MLKGDTFLSPVVLQLSYSSLVELKAQKNTFGKQQCLFAEIYLGGNIMIIVFVPADGARGNIRELVIKSY